MNRKKSNNIWIRLISAICITAICLAFFVGCDKNVSTEEFEKLEKDFSSANDELKALQETYDAALKENEALSSTNEAAKLEIEALKSENETAKQEIISLKNNNETAKQEITALKSENEAAKQTINDLKSENEAVKLEIETLKSENEVALEEIESLKSQLQDLLNYVTPDSSEEKVRIYIDQGHNPTSYHNAGASGNGLYEENLTFTIGRLLAGLLEFDGRFEVCLSRPTANTVLGTDNTTSLKARVKGAQEFEADYFVSLHINSYRDESANGVEVLAAEEDGTSYDFGSSILSELVNATGLRNRDMKHRPDLYVLKNATMPAVIVEMGFISNPTDSALLAQNPALFAQGIYDGILAYFNLQPNT